MIFYYNKDETRLGSALEVKPVSNYMRPFTFAAFNLIFETYYVFENDYKTHLNRVWEY